MRTQTAKKSHTTNTKISRVGLRVPPELKRAWEDAAALEGRSLSDVIISATTKAVAEIIDRQRIIRVSEADMEQIMADLKNPPKPNEILKRTMMDYRKATAEGELVIQH
jgi:uncharacterized protein (DUF1778 family)